MKSLKLAVSAVVLSLSVLGCGVGAGYDPEVETVSSNGGSLRLRKTTTDAGVTTDAGATADAGTQDAGPGPSVPDAGSGGGGGGGGSCKVYGAECLSGIECCSGICVFPMEGFGGICI